MKARNILLLLAMVAILALPAFAEEATKTVNPLVDQAVQALLGLAATAIAALAGFGAKLIWKSADAAEVDAIKERVKRYVLAAEEKFNMRKKLGEKIENAGAAKFALVKEQIQKKHPNLPIESIERFILAAVAGTKGVGAKPEMGE